MKVLKVEWKDHHSNSGWHKLNQIDTAVMVNTSVGFFIQETDESLILSQTLVPSEDLCAELLFILKQNIVNQKELH